MPVTGEAKIASAGRTLRFLANVDPVDVSRALEGLDPEATLVVVVSKTFTTAETMLNARTLKKWLVDHIKRPAAEVIRKHMIAVRYCTVIDVAYYFIHVHSSVLPVHQFRDSEGGRVRNRLSKCVRFLGLGGRPFLRLLSRWCDAPVPAIWLSDSTAVPRRSTQYGSTFPRGSATW